ncbi:titin-like isoform X2 [Branchiostoma floridae]|uniref:Titin-like isoform X2 n=1 Tax=Branchiostoma floridae TaxID=7739 RepID=A0A9J7L7F0_BRAFL|nr:titin-like isoform X2 [Branchiostoma floridae]
MSSTNRRLYHTPPPFVPKLKKKKLTVPKDPFSRNRGRLWEDRKDDIDYKSRYVSPDRKKKRPCQCKKCVLKRQNAVTFPREDKDDDEHSGDEREYESGSDDSHNDSGEDGGDSDKDGRDDGSASDHQDEEPQADVRHGVPVVARRSSLVPTAVRSIPSPSKPIGSEVSETSALLSWQPPTKRLDEIVGYKLEVRQQHQSEWTSSKNVCTETSCRIAGLTPDTIYRFRARAVTDTDESEPSYQSDPIRTLKSRRDPPGKPIATDVTETTARLTWPKPHDKSRVDRYIVESRKDRESNQSNWTEVLKDSDTSCEIRDLQPDTPYRFRVRACAGSDISQPGEMSEIVRTKKEPLYPPGRPLATDVTDRDVTLTWSPPDGGRKPLEYAVEHRREGRDEWTSCIETFKDTRCQLSGLDPETPYRFRVRSLAGDDVSMPSDPSDVVRTDRQKVVIPTPGKPKVSDVKDTEATLSWDTPKGRTKPDEYRVEVWEAGDEKWAPHSTVKKPPFTVDGLKPDTDHYFRVIPVKGEDVGDPSEYVGPIRTEKMKPPRPGKPKPSDVDESSINLSWPPPEKSEDVDEYILEMREDKRSEWKTDVVKTRDTHCEVPGLVADTPYRFRVRGVKDDVLGDPSSVSDPIYTRRPKVPTPGKPQASKITDDSLSLVWPMPLGQPKLALTGYDVECRRDDSDDWKYKTSCKEPPVKIEDLDSATAYRFRARAKTKYEKGDFGEESDRVLTDRGSQSPMKAININPDSLQDDGPTILPPGKPAAYDVGDRDAKISWPALPDGSDTRDDNLIGYDVEMQEEGESDWKDVIKGTKSNKCYVRDLKRESRYYFRVKANTILGESDYGETSDVVITTGNQEREDDSIPPPGKPEFWDVEETEAKLKWPALADGSDWRNDGITGYDVEMKKDDDDDWVSAAKGVNKTKCQVVGLNPATRYFFRVRALKGKRESEPGDVEVVVTQGKKGIPPPGKPVAWDVQEEQCKLQWPVFIDGGDERNDTTGYDVEMRKEEEDDWVSTAKGVKRNKCLVLGLHPGNRYYFRAQAITELGESEPGPPSDAVITPGKRGRDVPPPGKPGAWDTEETQTKLWWPALANGSDTRDDDITGYDVEMREDGEDEWQSAAKGVKKTKCRVVGLKPGTKYFFRVRAETDDNESEPGEDSDVVITKSQKPAPPGKPEAWDVEEEETKLRWPALPDGSDTRDDGVTKYDVEMTEDGKDDWKTVVTSVNDNKCKLIGLSGGTNYRFRVTAIGKEMNSDPSEMSDLVETPIIKKSITPPGKPEAYDTEETETKLSWPALEDGSKYRDDNVTRYEVEMREDGKEEWHDAAKGVDDTKCKITGLQPATKYYFRVRAGTDEGEESEPGKESDVVETPATRKSIDPPGKPVAWDVETTETKLKWPVLPDGSYRRDDGITEYEVELREEDEPDGWRDAAKGVKGYKCKIKGLNPGTRYRFRARAVSDIGQSEPGEESDIVETRGEMIDPPGKPEAYDVQTNEMKLWWHAHENGRDDRVDGVTGYDVEMRQEGSDQWLCVAKNVDDTKCKLKGMAGPDKKLWFRVKALKNDLASEPGEESDVVTIPDGIPPTGKPEAWDVEETQTKLRWPALADGSDVRYDNITGYDVEMREEGSSKWNEAAKGVKRNKCKVIGLEPGRHYYFRVQAMRGDEESEHSEPSNVVITPGQRTETEDKPVPQVIITTLDNDVLVGGASDEPPVNQNIEPPGMPFAWDVEAVTLKLRWTPLWNCTEDRYDQINGYEIEKQEAGSEEWVLSASRCVKSKCRLRGLKPGTQYRFRVIAVKDDRKSKPGRPSEVITTPPLVPPPGKPESWDVTTTEAKLQWSALADDTTNTRDDGLTGYDVEMKEESWSEWQPAANGVKKNKCKIVGLQPASNYYFRVRANTTSGVSDFGEESDVVATTERGFPTDNGVTLTPVKEIRDGEVDNIPPTGKPEAWDTEETQTKLRWPALADGSDTRNDGITGYDVEMREDGSYQWHSAAKGIKKPKCRVVGLEPGRRYYFRIQAMKGAAESAHSEVSDVVITPGTRTDVQTPVEDIVRPPGKPSAYDVDERETKLRWPALADGSDSRYDDITGYDVEILEDGTHQWKSQAKGVKGTKCRVIGLEPGTLYYFRVQAMKGPKESEPSEVSDAVRTLGRKRRDSDDLETFAGGDRTGNPPRIQDEERNGQLTIGTIAMMSLWPTARQEADSLPLPGQPEAFNVSETETELQWPPLARSSPVQHDPIDGYFVEVRKSGEQQWRASTRPCKLTKCKVKGLLPDTAYYFRVKSARGSSESGASETSHAVVTPRATDDNWKERLRQTLASAAAQHTEPCPFCNLPKTDSEDGRPQAVVRPIQNGGADLVDDDVIICVCDCDSISVTSSSRGSSRRGSEDSKLCVVM